ncbi:MAG TPA: anti-sigma factor [Planctomycetota bacterium]|nr:anti-sigma factor [Planctomycetota bacterium]
MVCGFEKGLIAAHYDGETAPEERLLVERHLATCSECARDLASMKGVSAALKPLARAAAPVSIAEGVIREIGASRPARRPWKAWLASAAAAVLAAVGTVYMLDRSREAPSREVALAAEKPASPLKEAAVKTPAAPREEEMARSKQMDAVAERKVGPADHKELAESPQAEAAPPPAAPAPPAAPKSSEPALSGRSGGAKAASDEEDRFANRWQKAAVPVVRITTPDPALARAEVDEFLKERERRQTVAGAALLGRTTFVRDRYLQIELSEEESKELEKRLAALKETLVAPGSFEEEKKRVAEEAAKLKKEDSQASKAHLKPDDAKDKEAVEEKEESEKMADRARALGKDRGVLRKKVIFVFELPPPPKK